jgi:hypothetical protein
MGGIQLESDYPYEERDDQCRYDPSKFQAKVNEIHQVEQNNEVSMQEALIKYGPLSIGKSSIKIQPHFK